MTIIFIVFMQGIYQYIPETDHVSWAYSLHPFCICISRYICVTSHLKCFI